MASLRAASPAAAAAIAASPSGAGFRAEFSQPPLWPGACSSSVPAVAAAAPSAHSVATFGAPPPGHRDGPGRPSPRLKTAGAALSVCARLVFQGCGLWCSRRPLVPMLPAVLQVLPDVQAAAGAAPDAAPETAQRQGSGWGFGFRSGFRFRLRGFDLIPLAGICLQRRYNMWPALHRGELKFVELCAPLLGRRSRRPAEPKYQVTT